MEMRTVRDGDKEIEVPRSEVYPPYVETEADMERWDVSAELARSMFEGMDSVDEGHLWLVTRRFYHSNTPTTESK